jgi:hypothetical protein
VVYGFPPTMYYLIDALNLYTVLTFIMHSPTFDLKISDNRLMATANGITLWLPD